jgi:hypothetical protein
MSWLREQARQGMNPRTYVLLGLLIAALVTVQSLDEQSKRARLRARGAGGAPPPAQLAASAPKQGLSTPTEPGWGSDPFRRRFGPEGAPAAVPPSARREAPLPPGAGLYLQGVMNGPSGRTALINGEVYREGERVGSREILQIGARTVMLMDKGTVTTLTLKGDAP